MAARSFAILCAALLLGFSAAAVASTGSSGTSVAGSGGQASGGGSGGGAGHAGGGSGSAGHSHSGTGFHGASHAVAAHGHGGAASPGHQHMHVHSHMPDHPHHFRMTSFADVSNHSGLEWAPYCVQDNYLERFYNCPGTRKRTTVFDPGVSGN